MKVIEKIKKGLYPKINPIVNAIGEKFNRVEDIRMGLLWYPTKTNFPLQLLFFVVTPKMIRMSSTMIATMSDGEIIWSKQQNDNWEIKLRILSYELNKDYSVTYKIKVDIMNKIISVENEEGVVTKYPYLTIVEWKNTPHLADSAFFHSYLDDVIYHYLVDAGVFEEEDYDKELEYES
ncbi:hypothetical protein KBI51_06140 [Aerococcaceae bacterium zg-ZUI334]|uniref:hypothetical protein n=1 Tax=Aerococcaceae TaxID=186827 RepID=UPI0013B5FC47|nr:MULTISPECIES: hypothetical protein [unclassified Facklamia]MBR7927754.1 hypothetical protein [Aerococcaceae bacterium zg-ZUI334]MBS4462093.1 hypothetical protein [Aerococcaceae bacterium zg-B36]QQD65739.1 hypothetical protein JDW14_01005 [Aerococcaceae bacterium zg-252]NEW64557.1 hypothetical protein [Facklamia sp. 252]NEW67764.1 hypothetical protein [Facklamia sp. 253]